MATKASFFNGQARSCAKLAFMCVLLASIAGRAQAVTEQVLYSFMGGFGGPDAAYPFPSLIRDAAGNLYGTTPTGGAYGRGTVYVVSPNGTEKLLHSFTGGTDGDGPQSSLIQDASGYLYGTTESGGTYGSGVVFVMNPTSGAEKVLYSFTGGADGSDPIASLVRDSRGFLYGTTSGGGAYGRGTLFVVSPNGSEEVLYSFTGGTDGGFPRAALIEDAQGLFYGTTPVGGLFGDGVVFRFDRSRGETVLHSFTGGADGSIPYSSLIEDANGNLYGTTQQGGAYGYGIVFIMSSRTGAEKVLHSFTGGRDGSYPDAGLIQDVNGNLYGAARAGGTNGLGTVFLLIPTTGTLKVLYSFAGGTDGNTPESSLIQDSNHNLYGTTWDGGAYGWGTVYMLVP